MGFKYFEEDVRSLEGAIQDVRYESPFGFYHNGWPARCPTEAATQVTERDDGMVDYRFDYTNAHSKEEGAPRGKLARLLTAAVLGERGWGNKAGDIGCRDYASISAITWA